MLQSSLLLTAALIGSLLCADVSRGQCSASETQRVVGDTVLANDRCGNAVSIRNATAAVGAWFADPAGANSGTAYVFTSDAGSWMQSAALVPADAAANDWFGTSLAVTDGGIIVGAANADRSSTNFDGRGAAYVFEHVSGVWTQTSRLVATTRAAGDRFGTCLALDGDLLAVGVPQSVSNGPGKVVLFRSAGGVWSQEATLTATAGMPGDGFGSAVAVSGARVAVGAPLAANAAGRSYVFEKISGVWQERAALARSGGLASELFGSAVAIQNTELFVGAPQAAVAGATTGNVTRFEIVASQWTQRESFVASNAGNGANFGASLTLRGNVLIAGASHDLGGGAAYTFLKSGGVWNQVAKLFATSAGAAARFGTATAFHNGVACIGAPQFSATASNAGAAFMFTGLSDALPDSCIANGACCFPNNVCLIIAEPDCVNAGATFAGADTDCADTTGEGIADACEVGACCTLDGTCSITTIIGCDALGGTYDGANSTCTAANCQPRGACCRADGTCDEPLSENDCVTTGGIFRGTASVCAQSSCDAFGACCFADATCTAQTTLADCTMQSGIYGGDDSDCVAAACVPFGGCCTVAGMCLEQQSEADCLDDAGLYLGDESDCDGATCVVRGACCMTDQACVENVEQPTCELSGQFLGPGADCVDVICSPLGACCDNEMVCSLLPETACDAAGGIFRGDDTTCNTESCLPRGACCMPDGNCAIQMPEDCAAMAGYYLGDESTCDDAQCDDASACCLGFQNCVVATIADCAATGGIWQGPSLDCADVNCPQRIGACCLPNGNCLENVLRTACLAQAGIYGGDESDCNDAQCNIAGACCLSGNVCLTLIEAACSSISGSWQGPDSTCTTFSACTALLRGDVNCDGALTVSDIGPFVLVLTDLATYTAQFPHCDPLTADMNLDGATTVSDIGGIIAAVIQG
ncbi:MAG: hypothetical protein AB7N71_01335 [Phycisphaerae bacterium]